MILLSITVAGLVVYPMATALGESGDIVKKGEYIVNTSGCHDCHSPKIFTPDGMMQLNTDLLLSGHPAGTKLPEYDRSWVAPGQWVIMTQDLTAFVGPWGVTCAANLTPDDQTGIGLWKEEHFIKAMRTGKHMGEGRPIMPPMPWQGVAQFTDDDLKAVFAYLKSLEPIKNAVPAPDLVPPPGH
jgi:hypothetical protein